MMLLQQLFKSHIEIYCRGVIHNSSPCISKSMKILNQPKRYVDVYLNYIDIQVIEIYDYYYDSDMEETHEKLICLTLKKLINGLIKMTQIPYW